MRDDPIHADSPASPDDPPIALLELAEEEAYVEEDGVIRSGKLAGKPMGRAIWIVALPILLQQTMQACVGLVDKLIAGNLPGDIVVPALDGLGIGTYVGWFVSIAMAGLGVGGQAIIARAMGSGDRRDGHGALGQSILLAVAWGCVVGLVMWLLAAPLASISGLTAEATRWCTTYVRTISLAMPACGVMMVGAMCLHGAGEATKPFAIAIVVNLVNTIGSWLLSGVELRVGGFVVANPVPVDPATYGVLGIALGTAISYVVGAVMTWRVLRRGVKDLELEWRFVAPDTAMAKRIVRVGLPNFFEGLAMWSVQLFVMLFIGQVAATRAAAGEGDGGLIAAHTITVQWEAFSFLPGFAMGTAAGAVAGQYLGAGNPRLARRAIWRCTFIGMAIMGALGIVFMTEGRALTRFISDQPILLELVPQTLFICGIGQVFFALAMVVRNGLRGVGDTVWILWITVASCYLLRLPLAWFLGVYLGLGLVGIWIGLMGELVVRGFLFLARFVWGGWEKLRV